MICRDWPHAEIVTDRKLLDKPLIPAGIPECRVSVSRPVSILEFHEVGAEHPEKYPRRSLMLDEEEHFALDSARISGRTALYEVGAGELVIEPDPADPARGVAFVLDFGRPMAAKAAIEIDAPDGCVVDLVYGEFLWDVGKRVRAARPEAFDKYNYTDHFVLRKGRNTVGSPFLHRGFRMLGVVIRNFAEPVRVLGATATEWHYPLVRRGEFHCSDPLLDRIWQLSVRTIETCTTDIFTDCVWREHAFWINDLLVQNAISLAAFGASALHKRAFRLLFSQQRPEGLIPGVCPTVRGTAGENVTLLPTNLFVFIMLRDYLFASGERDVVAGYLPALQRILDCFEHYADADGVLTAPKDIWNFYDWSFELNNYSFNGCRESMLNFLYVAALKIYCQLCDDCGVACPERAALLARAQRTAAATLREFGSAEDGLLVDGVLLDNKPDKVSSRLAHAIALLSGELPENLKTRYRTALVCDKLLEPELYLYFFLFRAMLEAGEGQWVAAGLEKLRLHWGKQVESGYPTLAEAGVQQFGWRAFHQAASLCHAFSGSPIEFFQRGILGVRPLAPGFEEFAVEPHLVDLKFASGRIPTPQGEIGISCRRSRPGKISVELMVPAGLVAITPAGARLAEGAHAFELDEA